MERILERGTLFGKSPTFKADLSLLSKFASHLPDLRATFSLYDEPSVYVPWSRRESLIGSRESRESFQRLNIDLRTLCGDPRRQRRRFIAAMPSRVQPSTEQQYDRRYVQLNGVTDPRQVFYLQRFGSKRHLSQ